jgi:hypothetical protein
MSVYFEVDGQIVWNPASERGRSFLADARVIERALDVRSGLPDFEADECAIDKKAFPKFLQRCLVIHMSEAHETLRPRLDAVLVTSLVMAARGGMTVPYPDDLQTAIDRQAALMKV